MTHYDLVIVGGGLVGAGLAAALRQSSINIALIDARLPQGNDSRLFALNASSCRFLENVGIWPVLTEHAAPIHQVHVSHQRHFGAVRLKRQDVAVESLGHVIPAHFIEKALNDLLLTQKNLTLYRPAKLTGLDQQDDKVTLAVSSQSSPMTARFVVGADGAESSVRQLANIEAQSVDYHQSALVTRTLLQRPHQHIAYERFIKNGAIAMLPLTGDECATIWTADNAMIDDLLNMSDEAFLQKLQNEFGYRLGRLKAVKERQRYPLRMVRAEKPCEKNILLLGNAAHTLHPIAAQGFNLALYEVAVVAEALAKEQVDLAGVVARVKKQQAASMSVSHYLPQLFSHDLLRLFSQLGMVGFDLTMPLKKKFMTSMMGRTGQVPSLLLGAVE